MRVQWDKTSVVAHQGDNVTLFCTARAVDFLDVVRLTLSPSSHYSAAAPRAHASSVDNDSSPLRWTIADNNVVKSPFLALRRYGVRMSVDGRRAVARLRLTGEYLPSLSPRGPTIYHQSDDIDEFTTREGAQSHNSNITVLPPD